MLISGLLFAVFFLPPPMICFVSVWSSAELMLGDRPNPEVTLAVLDGGGRGDLVVERLDPPTLLFLRLG
jgi:hypothetical protein